MSGSAVAKMIQRHRLAATGSGKARRYARSTVEALRANKGKGTAIGTTNDYLQAVKQFVRWMVENDRMRKNPLLRLKAANARTDRRRRRGAFVPEELVALLHATAASRREFRGLSGRDRRMLYLVALSTGFRAAELARVAPASFDLSAKPPTLFLSAKQTKNKKPATQPLPAELVEELRAYLSTKAAGAKVWPGTWYRKAADMLRPDLEAANVPFTIEGTEGPEMRDFHGFRCT